MALLLSKVTHPSESLWIQGMELRLTPLPGSDFIIITDMFLKVQSTHLVDVLCSGACACEREGEGAGKGELGDLLLSA